MPPDEALPDGPGWRGRRKRYRGDDSQASRRSDHGDTATAVGAVDESCRLNRANHNILSEARIDAPELSGYQVSVDPI